jgi:hypothetical protein
VELLPEARRLVEAQDFTRARVVLQQVLKVQSKHTGARELLGEIQRRMVQRQRDERMRNARVQAEDALSRRDFEQALTVLKEGLEVDPANAELLAMREKVQLQKRKQEQVDGLLRQVESARRRGDIRSAMASAQEALNVDNTNSKVVAIFTMLSAEAEEARKKAEAKALLESVRRQLDSRQFEKALESLHKVEELIPADPEVQLLIGDANAGLEQNRRRELISSLEQQVTLAANLEQLQNVVRAIQEAQAAMPAESALFRLSAQADRRLKELANRRLVEETYQRCRDLRPREALEMVRSARERLPDDEKLMSLEALITERLQQHSVEERRGEYLSRAREALQEGKSKDAIHILESCEAEGIANSEVLSLLEFARAEEREINFQQLKRSRLVRAQQLVSDGDYDEAVGFLQDALSEGDDTALRLLLEQAVTARHGLQRQVEAALASAGRLVQAGKVNDALELLRGQPREVLRSSRVQMAIAAVEDERDLALFRMTGRAYGLLNSDLGTGHRIMQRVAAASVESSPTAAVAIVFRTHEQASADRALVEAVQKSETLVRSKDLAGAETLVREADRIADLASPQRKSEWRTHTGKLSRKGLRNRVSS